MILADPPWHFKTRSDKGMGRSADKHYGTMGLKEIKALPVSEIAAKDSVLLMWATFPLLPQALEVIEAWGFSYKTVAFSWLKQNKGGKGLFSGMGYWTRSNGLIV